MKGGLVDAGSSFFEQVWLGVLTLFGGHLMWTNHFDKVQNEKDHSDLWAQKVDKDVVTLLLEEMRSSREERQRESREDRLTHSQDIQGLRDLIERRTNHSHKQD